MSAISSTSKPVTGTLKLCNCHSTIVRFMNQNVLKQTAPTLLRCIVRFMNHNVLKQTAPTLLCCIVRFMNQNVLKQTAPLCYAALFGL